MPIKPDLLVDEVRNARREISRECGHDLWKLYGRYENVQRQMKAEGKGKFLSKCPVDRTHDAFSVTAD